MKRSKREENGIVIHFIFYMILLILLLIYILSSLLPKIYEIENLKEETINVYNEIKIVEKKGISFNKIKEFNKGSKNFVSKIINNIDENFYNKNFINTEFNNYEEFLKNKEEFLNSPEFKNIILTGEKKIENLLPLYSDVNLGEEERVLTDYKFVNYVESIIESFDLYTESPIGIKEVVLLEDFAVIDNNGKELDSNIYSIPLSLSLKGNKSGIIDFLYFVENVGNIKINDKDIKINDKSDFLSNNGFPKVLEGDKKTRNYNIFKHQIIDIKKIYMPKYIDSSYVSSEKDKDLKEFIKKTQGNKEYEIEVTLNFYVVGLPIYKIKELILDTVNNFNEAKKIISLKLKTTGKTQIEAKKYNTLLKNIESEIKEMRVKLAKKKDLNDLYKRAKQINIDMLEPIFKTLK